MERFIALNALACSVHSFNGVDATTVADRGQAYNSASSPNPRPGPSVATCLAVSGSYAQPSNERFDVASRSARDDPSSFALSFDKLDRFEFSFFITRTSPVSIT